MFHSTNFEKMIQDRDIIIDDLEKRLEVMTEETRQRSERIVEATDRIHKQRYEPPLSPRNGLSRSLALNLRMSREVDQQTIQRLTQQLGERDELIDRMKKGYHLSPRHHNGGTAQSTKGLGRSAYDHVSSKSIKLPGPIPK